MMDGIVKIAGQRTNYQRRMHFLLRGICGESEHVPALTIGMRA